ncbi:MAG: hypothetical protein ACE5JO_04805 [Candidatus Binatia bacterium]
MVDEVERLGQAAQTVVRKHHPADTMVQQLEGIYEDLLERGKSLPERGIAGPRVQL